MENRRIILNKNAQTASRKQMEFIQMELYFIDAKTEIILASCILIAQYMFLQVGCQPHSIMLKYHKHMNQIIISEKKEGRSGHSIITKNENHLPSYYTKSHTQP